MGKTSGCNLFVQMLLELIDKTNPGVVHVSRPPFLIMDFLVFSCWKIK